MSGTFKKAGNFFQRGQYGEVIRILEPQIFRFRDSYDFYFLLGMSCLYTNDVGSAFTYLQRAYDLAEAKKEVLLALAVVHLHRNENNEALRSWLHVLEIDPKEKKAQKGLNILRSSMKKEKILDDLEEGKFDRLLPVRKKTRKKIQLSFIIIILLILIALSTVPLIIVRLKISKEGREGFEIIELDSTENLLETQGEYYFLLTDEEVKSTVEKINSYFLAYRDNLAMREINRILLSNAGSELKNKVSTLEENIRIPGFADFKNNYDYQEVKAEPHLYRKCYVSWKGRATNVQTDEEKIRFDFLVGYEDEKVLQGIVTVFLDFAADITPDFPIEVLAEVVPSSGGDFYLKCVAIHRLWD